MKKLNCLYLLLIFFVVSCSTKTTNLIIDSNPNVVFGKTNEIKITREQKGYNQTNDSNAEYLNYYFFLVKDKKDIPIKTLANKTNQNCVKNLINIHNGNMMSNTFNRNILFKKENHNISIYIDCIPEVYQFKHENEQNIKIKLIIEDKEFTKIKDSITFNITNF